MAIARLQSQSNTLILNPQDARAGGESLVRYTRETLKKVNGSQASFVAIDGVSFSDSFMEHFGTQAFGHTRAQEQNQQMYSQGVNALISILRQEKDRYKQILDDEAQQKALKEQKKGNWIQIATLICSIVAALAALYPIIEPLIKKMFN